MHQVRPTRLIGWTSPNIHFASAMPHAKCNYYFHIIPCKCVSQFLYSCPTQLITTKYFRKMFSQTSFLSILQAMACCPAGICGAGFFTCEMLMPFLPLNEWHQRLYILYRTLRCYINTLLLHYYYYYYCTERKNQACYTFTITMFNSCNGKYALFAKQLSFAEGQIIVLQKMKTTN